MKIPMIRLYDDIIEGQKVLEIFFDSGKGEEMNAKAIFRKEYLTPQIVIEMFRRLADAMEKGL